MDLDEIWRDDSHAVPKDRRPPQLSVGRKDGNARHARLPAVLPITTTRKRPLPTKGTFKSLSKYVTKVLSDDPDASVGRRGLLIDHIIKKEQMDVFGQLDGMIKGKKAKSEEGTPFKHFSPLSLDTELESTFADSAMVKRVYLQELKEWMSKKPLDICMMGRLPIVDDQPGPIRPSLKTDKTLKKCMEEFRAGMYDLLHDGEDKFDPDNVFPCPQSSTEETTDQVFRQVTKYMNFLASKSFLVEDDPSSRGSQRPQRTDTRSERLPQAIMQNRNLTDKISQENISLTEDHSRRVHPSEHLIESRFRQDVDETQVHHSNYKERGQHETPVDSKNTSDYASASEYQRQDQSKSRHVLDDCTNAVKATSTSDRGKKILLDPVPLEKHQSDNRTDQLKRGSRTTRNHSSENILEQETRSVQIKEPVATVPQGTRPWASRPGFKDRMEAILVDREVAKPIPLEPEDQNQSSKQLHHKNSTKISPDSPEAISKLSGQVVPSKQITEKPTQTRKLSKGKNKDYGKDDENKSKKKISHTETLEIKKSTKETEVLVDKGKDDQDTTGTSAAVMYSPTQPTGPDDFLFDLVEHDMKEEKDQIGRKRKVKDAESVLSKKKKKDKDKNKEEEKKRDDKKKKEKKEKKKDKDKKDKRKRSEKSRGESDQSEDEGKPKQRNLRRDHYAAPVLSLEEEILEDGEILDDESVHSAKFQGQKSFKSINLHVTEKDQSDITSLPNKAELGTTLQDGPDLEATSQDPSKLSSVFIEYFMDANSHLLNKLQEVGPDVNSFHSRILEPENSFLWALVLAFHAKQREEEETVEQMLQVQEPDNSKPVPQSHGSAANNELSVTTAQTAAKVEIIDVGSNDTPMNEYGSVVAIETKSDQVQQDMPEDRESGELTPDGSDNRFDDKASGNKKRGSSRLLQAFRQQVEAKKKATLVSEEHKQKTIIKLSADQAAKKPAPKSAKPLFIPPTFIKQLDGNQTASASSKEAGQGQNPGGLSIILPNNEMIDTSVKSAFDIFAEKIKDLLKEKFKKDVLDELAKDAQTLLSKSASEMKHLNSLSAIAFSIYRQHKQGVKSVNGAVKETSLNKTVEQDQSKPSKEQDQSKPSKDNTNRKSSVEKDSIQRSEKSPAKGRKGNADAWKIREKLDEIDLEESQATHIEDRSKITKDIMDGHEKLDFEKDKSHKDISRLRKIGRPSYLFSARIERLVAEQKEKDEQKKMLELEQQRSVTEIELPHVEPVTIINDTVSSVAIDTVNDVTDSSVAVAVPVPEDVIEILEEEPEEIVEETKETYLVEEVPSHPVGESTTEADEEESKPKKVSMTLPKGNKLMMAFRQAMLAKKKAQQKEGFKSTTAANKVGIQVTHQFGVKLKTSDLGQSNTAVSTVPGSAITTTAAPIVITSLTMSSSASTGSTPFSRASTMVTNSLPSQVITTSTVSCTKVPVPAPQIELPKVIPSQIGISHSAVPFQIDLTSDNASESQPSITSTSTVPVQKSANLQVQPTPEMGTILIPPSIPKKKPALLPTPSEYPVPLDTSIPPPGYGPPSVPPPGYGPPSGPPPGYAPSVPPPGYNQDLASGYNLPPVTGPPPGYNMPPASGQTPTGYPSSQDNTVYSSTSGSNQYNQSFHSFVPDFSKPPPLLPTPVSHQPGPPGIHTPDFHHSAPPGSHSGSSGSTQTGSYQTGTSHSDSQEARQTGSHAAVPQSPHHPIPPQTEPRQKSPDKHTKTDDLSAIPLPPSASGNTESVTKLDQSMYDDPEMIEQYQRKVQEFLKQKKTGTAVSSNSYDGSQSSYTDWNQYYSDYSADQNNKPLPFDQWQQRWFTYWDSVSNQYTQWGDQSQGQGHWGGGRPPWGGAPPPSSSSDYNQQWNDWQRWNQTPDYSKPPPALPPVPGTETNPPASSQSSGSSQPAKPQRGSQSPQQADDQQDSVNKDMEIETDTEAEVVEEEDSQSKHLHIYVFNHDREECCQQVKDYLVSMGARIFDCNNVDMYRFPVSPSETYLVFIHTDDLKHLHRIPNLYRMKQTPRIQFLTFSSLEQVKDKKCKPILAHGGILLPDDAALMGLTPHSLELLLGFLLTETRQDRSWCLLIHKHLFSEIDKMRLHYNENSVDYQRLVDLAQLLVRYEDYGVVETLINHKCNVETRPPEEYLQCCLEQQAKCCGRARHCFLISAMTPTHPSMDIFRNFGVGVMTLSNFLQVVANKPPAAVLPMPIRKYGLRESSIFRDCSLSNCVKTIRVNIPSHIPAVPKRPLISCPVPPPGEQKQKTPLLPSPDEYCSTVVMGTGPDMDIQEVDMEIS